ncbi:VOC family protein [Flavihumibacter sp. R14]|nr:VOC family protein [Flavihumibacter soli]
MTQLSPYLTFNGNCREAMSFYQKCLGGELELQSIADSPMACHLPKGMRECILHATLTSDHVILMGSDIAPQALFRGNANSMILTFNSEEEIRKTYAQLANGSEVLQPLEFTFRGALFGNLTDKYGNHWLFNFLDKSA